MKRSHTSVILATALALGAVSLLWQRGEIAQLHRSVAQAPGGSASGESEAGGARPQLTTAAIEMKIREVVREGSGNTRNGDWYDFIRDLKPGEILRVLALVEKVTLKSRRADLRSMLLQQWAGKAGPDAPLEYASRLANGSERSEAVGRIALEWIDHDPQAAAEWIQQLPAGLLRNEVVQEVLPTLDQRDPADAWVLSRQNGSYPGNAYMNFYSWAQMDLPAAVAAAAESPLGQNRWGADEAIAQVWAVKDPGTALAWAQGLTARSSEQLTCAGEIVSAWAKSDPQAAATAVLNLPPGAMRDSAMSSLADGWAAVDPANATAWAQQLPEGPAKDYAMEAIGVQWSGSSVEAALGYAHGLPAGRAQDNMLEGIASTWANNDPKGAVAWAASLPDSPGRPNILYNVYQSALEKDPADVAGIVTSLPADEQTAAAERTAFAWSLSNPAAAAAWAATLPEGALSSGAAEKIEDNWAVQDPVAAGQWLATLPAGAALEAAATAYVGQAGLKNPVLAAPWAVSIADENTRNNCIEEVAEGWLKLDPAAAAAWLAQTSLPDARKQKLLNPGKGN